MFAAAAGVHSPGTTVISGLASTRASEVAVVLVERDSHVSASRRCLLSEPELTSALGPAPALAVFEDCSCVPTGFDLCSWASPPEAAPFVVELESRRASAAHTVGLVAGV